MSEIVKEQLFKRIIISIFLQTIKLKTQKIYNKALNNNYKSQNNNLIAKSRTLKLQQDNNHHYHKFLIIALNRKNCPQRTKSKMNKSYS